MGLAGDAEALVTDDGVAAMVQAVTEAYGGALFGATSDASSIGAIGGADGPTSVYVAGGNGGFQLFPDSEESDGAIGGADGPTSVYVSGKGGFDLFPDGEAPEGRFPAQARLQGGV